MRVMYLTLKRQKSISSQAASISAWCAVFDWPSIVAALSVWRHGPARSSAARRKIGGALLPRRARPVLPRVGRGRDRALDLLRAALVHGGEHVRAVVRLDRLERVAGANLLAADHERDLERLDSSSVSRTRSSSRSGVPGA